MSPMCPRGALRSLPCAAPVIFSSRCSCISSSSRRHALYECAAEQRAPATLRVAPLQTKPDQRTNAVGVPKMWF
eukprot:3849855-Pyramimonas_sp.AAC.1